MKLPNIDHGDFKLAGRAFLETAQTIITSFVITSFIYIFLAIPNQVEGSSMETNFHNGDLLITNKLIQILHTTGIGNAISYKYRRGDVIIFQQPGKPDYIKRIIAKGGDTIMFDENKVIVNGKLLHEDYIKTINRTLLPAYSLAFLKLGEKLTVPKGKYFVMGDNREHSQDSRFKIVGWVDEGEIKGRVFIRYWPPTNLGIMLKGQYEELPYNR